MNNIDIDNYILGNKVKEFRHEKGYSLAQAGDAIGVSAAFISMVENGKSGITFQKLHALLELYDKTFADLSAARAEDENIVNINNAQIIASENGVRLSALAKRFNNVGMGGYVLYAEPGCYNEFDRHKGGEFVYVLNGEIELHLVGKDGKIDDTKKLSAGDSIAFSAEMLHSYKNTGSEIASVLIVEASKTVGI